MIGFILAPRYAKAVIDLAQDADQVSQIGEELNKIAGLFAEMFFEIIVNVPPVAFPFACFSGAAFNGDKNVVGGVGAGL